MRGDSLDDVLCGHETVGDVQRVACLKIYLVLPCRDLVMARLYYDAHLLQRMHHLTTHGGGEVGGEVEIATSIMWQRVLVLAFCRQVWSRKNSSSGATWKL